MYISDKQHRGASFEEITLGERIWQFIRFTVVTGMIFAVSFMVMNFQAYKSILVSVLNPEVQAQAEQVLTDSSAGAVRESLTVAPVLPTKREEKRAFTFVDFPVAPTDNRIVIPKIGKSVPLIDMSTEYISGELWSGLETQIQDGLRKGVVHYPGTAKPGQYGNVFMTGHSSYYPWDDGKFKDVFALLGRLEQGDEFMVYYDQIKYVYKVTGKREVQPDEVNVLEQPQDMKVATLMTCTPVGTTLRRLIIQAEQVS